MRLSKEFIDQVFDDHTDQGEVIATLWKHVFPQWDDIESIEGYPQCSEECWVYIANKFRVFDKEHHPDVMPGGAWMNWGFSGSKELSGSEISVEGVKITMKKQSAVA